VELAFQIFILALMRTLGGVRRFDLSSGSGAASLFGHSLASAALLEVGPMTSPIEIWGGGLFWCL